MIWFRKMQNLDFDEIENSVSKFKWEEGWESDVENTKEESHTHICVSAWAAVGKYTFFWSTCNLFSKEKLLSY